MMMTEKVPSWIADGLQALSLDHVLDCDYTGCREKAVWKWSGTGGVSPLSCDDHKSDMHRAAADQRKANLRRFRIKRYESL